MDKSLRSCTTHTPITWTKFHNGFIEFKITLIIWHHLKYILKFIIFNDTNYKHCKVFFFFLISLRQQEFDIITNSTKGKQYDDGNNNIWIENLIPIEWIWTIIVGLKVGSKCTYGLRRVCSISESGLWQRLSSNTKTPVELSLRCFGNRNPMSA